VKEDMGDMTLTKIRIKEGVWHGELVLDSDEKIDPKIEVLHHDSALDGVVVRAQSEKPGHFVISVPIPANVLTDGVQTFVIMNAETEKRLNAFSIITGQPMENDIRAEIDLLREELDMLKRAFRRHCVETM